MLLGTMLLAWLLMLLESLGILSGWTASHTRFAFWGNQLFLIIGPLLYLYTCSVLNPAFRLRPIHLWHLTPLLLMLIPTQIAWQSLEEEIRVVAVQNAFSMRDGWLGFLMLVIYVQFGIYLVMAFRELQQYRRQLADNYSREDQIQLPWLRFFLWGILVVVMVGLVQNLLRFLTDSEQGYQFSVLLGGVVLLTFFVWFILKALRQPEIFSGISPVPTDPPEKHLSDQERAKLQVLAERVEHHMRTQEAFLQPDISLKELATQLSVPPRELSLTINRIFGQNFFDYINQNRIALAQQKITEASDPKMTMLEIMYEVGFQSKSSFNSAFKKFTRHDAHSMEGQSESRLTYFVRFYKVLPFFRFENRKSVDFLLLALQLASRFSLSNTWRYEYLATSDSGSSDFFFYASSVPKMADPPRCLGIAHFSDSSVSHTQVMAGHFVGLCSFYTGRDSCQL